MRLLKVVLTALVLGSLVGPAGALRIKPTLSGTMVSLDPASGRLVLRLGSGVEKPVHLVPACTFSRRGRPASASAFEPGCPVTIRLSGSIRDVPLQVDEVSDGSLPADTPPGPREPDRQIGILGVDNATGGVVTLTFCGQVRSWEPTSRLLQLVRDDGRSEAVVVGNDVNLPGVACRLPAA